MPVDFGDGHVYPPDEDAAARVNTDRENAFAGEPERARTSACLSAKYDNGLGAGEGNPPDAFALRHVAGAPVAHAQVPKREAVLETYAAVLGQMRTEEVIDELLRRGSAGYETERNYLYVMARVLKRSLSPAALNYIPAEDDK